MTARREGRWLMLENVLANYAYVGLMAGVTLFLTPLYVKRLGPEQWGAVALCMTVQGLLLLLDAGLGQVTPREFALRRDDRPGQWLLFVQILRIYGGVALAVLVFGQGLAGWLVPRFSAGAGDDAIWAVRLVVCQFVLSFVNSAPTGLWGGLMQQRRANVRLAGFMALKHGLALLLVFNWHATAWAYLLPFAVIGCIELAANLLTVRHEFSDVRSLAPASAAAGPANLLGKIGGFGAAVLVGMMTTQIDRALLASRLHLTEFGVYALVANFALAFMNLQIPLQKAFLPRVVSHGGRSANQLLYAVLVMCVLPCALASMFSTQVLTLWLHDAAIAEKGAPVFSLVLLGVALNGIYGAYYTRLVASNAWRYILMTNVLILIAQAVVLFWGVPSIGMLAGGWSWLVCGAMQCMLGRAYFWRRSS